MSNSKIFISFLFVLYVSSIFSYPYSEIPLPNRDNVCETVLNRDYDANTRMTVYGDSRLDFMGAVFPDIDFFLNAPAEGWNVQNFAKSGWNSDNLLNHLQTCMTASNPNYKTHKNILYHIGGNDFIHNMLSLYFLPFLYPRYVSYAADNNQRILTIFYQKGKNVLLSGHYPAVAASINLGKPSEYLKNYKIELGLNPYTTFAVNNSLFLSQFSACNGKEKLNMNLNGQYESKWSESWYKLAGTMGTLASIGVMNLEPLIEKMYNDRKSSFNNSPSRQQLDYQPIWNCFQWSSETDEPYVMNPALNADDVHPNYTGFALWGVYMSNKIRQMGYHTSNYSIADQGSPQEVNTGTGGESVSSGPDPLVLLVACFVFKKCHL